MDIEKIKQQADEKKNQQDEILKLQVLAEKDFNYFFEVSNKCFSLWKDKLEMTVSQFTKDFINYFKQNDFEIKFGNEFGYTTTITTTTTIIEADYNGSKIVLSKINYLNGKMSITNFDGNTEDICITLPPGATNYFYWKESKVLGDDLVSETAGPYKNTYKEFVKKFDSLEKIDELSKQIKIHVDHFQKGIDEVNTAEFYVFRTKDNKAYRSFNEFIKDYK